MTREEAYNRIDAIIAKHEIDDEYVTITNSKDYEALRTARKSLEQEPKYCDHNICVKNEYNGIGCEECEVTKSQEPFINKPCVSSGVCEHDKQKMLDKIRTEIELLHDWAFNREEILRIIDKYKTECEDKE